VNDGIVRCPHGFPASRLPAARGDGWVFDVPSAACTLCAKAEGGGVGQPYKPYEYVPPTPVVQAEEAPTIEQVPVTENEAPTSAAPADFCPTCGRPVVAGVPYDLSAIRKALVDALAAVDALRASERRLAQEAREELEELEGLEDLA